MYRKITIILLCAALCWGCFKSLSYSTVYVLKPLVQRLNQGPLTSLAGLKAYAFGADTTDWHVVSYEDALAGIITSKTAPSQKITTPVAIAEPFGVVDTIPNSVDWVQMSLDNPTMMIVVVDPVDSLYAYTKQTFFENLSPLYVSVTFQPWRDRTRYASGAWIYVNDFYDPNAPKWADYLLKPRLQLLAEGEESALQRVNLYAYAVDTTAWRIASYEDAVAGRITSKKNPEETKETPDYRGVPDQAGGADGWRRFSAKDEVLMVVAVDAEQEIYAYRRVDLVLNSVEKSEVLVFRPWRPNFLYVEEGWRVVTGNEPEVKPNTPKSR